MYKRQFIYKHNDEIYHFVYIKITQEKLNDLFTTNKESIHQAYVCIFFDSNNKYYTGYLNKNEIQQLISQSYMINLLDNNYDYLKTVFPKLTKEKYQAKIFLTNEQFEYFIQ